MTILAFEFSSPIRSVAVLGDNAVLGQAKESGARGTRPFALIDAALQEAGVSRHTVSRIAVGLGPGSHAGIRTAIAIARGWHSATGAEIAGFSSADCAAHQMQESGECVVAVDAQRGEFFGARFRKAGEQITLIEPFRVLTKEESPPLGGGRVFVRAGGVGQGTCWRAVTPDAMTLARMAAGALNATVAPGLIPIQLRRPDFTKAPPSRFSADG